MTQDRRATGEHMPWPDKEGPKILQGDIIMQQDGMCTLFLKQPITVIKDFQQTDYYDLLDDIQDPYSKTTNPNLVNLELVHERSKEQRGMQGMIIPKEYSVKEITFHSSKIGSLQALDKALHQVNLSNELAEKSSMQEKFKKVLIAELDNFTAANNPKKGFKGFVSTAFADKIKGESREATYKNKKEFLEKSIDMCTQGKFDQLIFLEIAEKKGFSDQWRSTINQALNQALAPSLSANKKF